MKMKDDKFVDLHVHSAFSDGVLSPSELVSLAAQAGLHAMALTDHDTVAGIDDALAAAPAYGIEVVPGVELSVAHNEQEVHLLGYFIQHNHPLLRETLQCFHEARFLRAEKIVAQLNRAGVPLVMEDVIAVAGNRPIGRPHVAEALRQKGFVQTFAEAFDRYLKRGAAAYVSKERWSPRLAIDVMHAAGGLAVVAHPLYSIPLSALEGLVAQGVDGIEVIHPLHNEEEREDLRVFALRHRLYCTGGSDYHGPGRSPQALGDVRAPLEWLERMRR